MEQVMLSPPASDDIVIHRTSTSQIWLEPEGIIVIRPCPGMQETLASARENLALVDRLAGTIKRPRLLDLRNGAPLPREVRQFYNQPEARQSAAAIGLLVDSGISRVIGNLLLGLMGKSEEVRLFTSEEAVRTWLGKFCLSER